MKNIKFYIVLIVILVNTILTGCDTGDNHVELSTTGETTEIENETFETIYVHISGEVRNPGVYSVHTNTRLYQVIDMAGGMTDKAYQGDLNLAEAVCDGQKIYVMSKKQHRRMDSESKQSTNDNNVQTTDTNLVNINVATVQQLTTLPGIGDTKAAAIVAYRDENGNFSSIEDIKNVSGIGEATFSNIESMITVN